METVRAILQMASAEAQGGHGDRTAGAAHFNRMSPGLHLVALQAIRVLHVNEMQPDIDHATASRLASAIERQSVNAPAGPDDGVARNILCDFLMQEAAAARLIGSGAPEPLEHHADPDSNRANLRPADALKRNGINPHITFDRATVSDLQAIAGGRYDMIQNDHTRFAVSTQLKMNANAMAMPTGHFHRPKLIATAKKPYPSFGLARGPKQQEAPPQVLFGKKVAER